MAHLRALFDLHTVESVCLCVCLCVFVFACVCLCVRGFRLGLLQELLGSGEGWREWCCTHAHLHCLAPPSRFNRPKDVLGCPAAPEVTAKPAAGQPIPVEHVQLFRVKANAMHAVRTQCKVLDVGKYSNPSFGPFSQASVEAVRFALQSTLPDR